VVCQHRRLVYPPPPGYDICYDCGKKQLRDPATGRSIGKFTRNLDTVLQTPEAGRSRGAVVQPIKMAKRKPKRPWLGRTDSRVVLVFRNGQRRRIASYAIGGRAVLVFTKRGTVAVPYSELDIAATQAENALRGIQFRVPA
jgi:hypothetical protein